jgi:hypothetical protein
MEKWVQKWGCLGHVERRKKKRGARPENPLK